MAGRSIRSDGEATGARILDAAGRLFARNGFARTTSKEVAAAAGVDLASINYHFSSRDGLYQAVLVEAHRSFISLPALQKIFQSAQTPEQKLRRLYAVLLRASRRPGNWQFRVFIQEVLSPTANLSAVFTREVEPKIGLVLRLLSELSGVDVRDPGILCCVLSAIGPCMLILLGSPDIPGPLQQIGSMPRVRIIDHLTRFTVAGLKAVGGMPAGGSARSQSPS